MQFVCSYILWWYNTAMKKAILIICAILIIASAIFWVGRKVVAPAPSEIATTSKSFIDLKNAAYNIDGVLITLKDGQNEQKIPGSVTITTTSYFGNDSEGDVNGDGKNDKAFLLIQDGGGTGLFTYLAVALKNDSGYTTLNTIFLGDRVAPQNTQIKDGVVTANYVDRLPTEPMVAEPTIGVSRYFKVEGGKLVEIKGEFGN
jgi:hypothetical protein